MSSNKSNSAYSYVGLVGFVAESLKLTHYRYNGGWLDNGAFRTDYMGTLSEDRAPYKRVAGPEEITELDRMKRALMVYKNWIWRDKLNIGELFTRVAALEQDQKDLREFLTRIMTASLN